MKEKKDQINKERFMFKFYMKSILSLVCIISLGVFILKTFRNRFAKAVLLSTALALTMLGCGTATSPTTEPTATELPVITLSRDTNIAVNTMNPTYIVPNKDWGNGVKVNTFEYCYTSGDLEEGRTYEFTGELDVNGQVKEMVRIMTGVSTDVTIVVKNAALEIDANKGLNIIVDVPCKYTRTTSTGYVYKTNPTYPLDSRVLVYVGKTWDPNTGETFDPSLTVPLSSWVTVNEKTYLFQY